MVTYGSTPRLMSPAKPPYKRPRVGLDGPLSAQKRATTQLFEGGNDLLTGPATAAGTAAGRIWCDSDTLVSIVKPMGDGVRLDITDESGHKVINRTWNGKTQRRGWHSVTAYAEHLTPYSAYINYTATPDLRRSECEF